MKSSYRFLTGEDGPMNWVRPAEGGMKLKYGDISGGCVLRHVL